MAVKASAHVTLSVVAEIQACYRYYLLQGSTLSAPSKPTVYPPTGSWVDSEPTYVDGSTNTLYFVDLNLYSDNTWSYSAVSKSSSYEAAKQAYNKAVAAGNAAQNAQDDIDNLEVGGRNYYRPSQTVDLGCTGSGATASLISTGSCIGFYASTVPGDIWTVSRSATTNNRFDYCFTVDEPANGVLIQNWNSAYRNALKIEGIVIPDGVNYLFLYLSNQNDDMPNVKLEKGNHATDWTPAPEDMATSEELTHTNSTVSDMNDELDKTKDDVARLEDEQSNFVKNETFTTVTAGLEIANGELETVFNKKVQDLETGLTKEITDRAALISQFYDPDKEVSGIAIGVKVNELSAKFTNEALTFERNNVPIVTLSGSKEMLDIKSVEIEDELQLGKFQWRSRDNGNMGLVWIGGDE